MTAVKKYHKRQSNVVGDFPCPMCCKESFTTQHSLKRHLVSVFENVKCPICLKVYDHVQSLIDHLATKCDGTKEIHWNSRNTRSSFSSHKKARTDEPGSYSIQENTMAFVSFKSPPIQTGAMGNHFLASGFDYLVANGNSTTDEVDPLADDNVSVTSEESEFQCSVCNVIFTDVNEHVRNFHSGQEIQFQNEQDPVKDEFSAKEEGKKGKVKHKGSKSKKDENFILKEEPVSSPKKPKNQTGDTGRRQAVFKGENKKIKKNISTTEINTELKVSPGYWNEKSLIYNYVRNEEKMKLLDPTFVPPKEKLNMSVKYSTDFSSMRVKLWFDELIMIQLVQDRKLIPCKRKFPNNLVIYVINKNVKINKSNLGGIAKVIDELPHVSKKKKSVNENEDGDDVESTICEKKIYNKSPIDDFHEQFIHILQIDIESDKEITIENINFKYLPSVPNYIVPFLHNVQTAKIPLLVFAKILKWYCTLCFSSENTFTNAFQHQCR